MRKSIGFLLCGIFLFCGAGVSSADVKITPLKISKPLIIDGKLDEAPWKQASAITNFIIQDTDQPARYPTRAYVLYDDNSFYIGFHCIEPDIKNIQAEKRPHDQKVFADDCVEIMLAPGSGNEYFHFIVNAVGSRLDRFLEQGGFLADLTWNGEWKSAVYQGKDFWSAEIAIPFYNFIQSSEFSSSFSWDINLCREKKNPEENSSIGKNGAFNSVGAFRKIEIPVDLTRFSFRIEEPAISTVVQDSKLHVGIKVPVTNNTGKSAHYLLDFTLMSETGKIDKLVREIRQKEKEPAILDIGEIIIDTPGKYQYMLKVRDVVTKKTLAFQGGDNLEISYVPMEIQVYSPWYRYAIFETQKIKDVHFDVKISSSLLQSGAKATLTAGIKERGKSEWLVKKSLPFEKESSSFLFPAGPLPYATLDIVAVLTDSSGKVIEEISRAIRKLPYQKGEVWLGKDMNWYVDGVPFFINGTWGHKEDVNPYYNVIFDWDFQDALTISGDLAWGKPRWVRDKIREGVWDEQLRNFYLERLQKAKATPKLFAHFFWDEISTYVVDIKVAEKIYNLLVEEDPYHPVLLTNGRSVINARNFAKCGDIISRHAYPRISRDVPINDMSTVVRVLEDVPNIRALHPYHRFTVPWLQQGFNYGDVSMRGVRMPSFIERRNEYLLALLLGADGIIQYNRQYNFYPELYIGVPHHTKEFAFLGDAILAPVSSLSVKSAPASIRTLLKETKKGLFLFVCNAQMEPVKATITVPGIGKHGSRLRIVSEDRTISLKNESFTDTFDTFEVRVYTTVKEIPDLTPVKEICAAIEKEYAKRKKPGNLAYQRYEDVTLTVTASSNRMGSAGWGGRANNGLWHVADGLCEIVPGISPSEAHIMYWQDTTKDEGPDWIELKFHTMQTIQKVVVFPHEKSLRDYEVQLFIDGNWKTVDKVSNRSDAEIVHTFKAEKTDRIRIWVTATNGPYAKIGEIEVY
jgi:hypothetical protein